MNNRFKIIFFLSFLLTYSFFIPTQIHAQNLSLSISPPILELVVKPGKNVTQSFKLTNDSDTSLVITGRLAEYTENGIKDNPDFEQDKWISLLNLDIALFKPFLLEKGKTQQIVVRINPPKEIKEADYNRVLLFTTKPQMPADRSQSQITQTIGVPLLLTVTATGNFVRSAQITKFTLPDYIDSFGPLTFDVLVKNTGQSFFHPNGNITLSGPVGRGSYPLIPSAILSQQEVKLISDMDSQQKEHTISIKGFFLGKYTVGVDFRLDDGSITVTEKKVVYAFPFKLIFIFFLIFLLLLKFRPKKKILSLFIITIYLCISSTATCLAKESGGSTNIKAHIPGSTSFRIFGYTSPNSLVQALGVRTFAQVTSDRTGYFLIDSLPVSAEAKEICLTTLDSERRIGFPLCMPLPEDQTEGEIGPLLLSPTISLTSGNFIQNKNEQITGMTLPNVKVAVSYFDSPSVLISHQFSNTLTKFIFPAAMASDLPTLTVTSDRKGIFTAKLPNQKAANYRTFAKGYYNNEIPTLKSQTLSYLVGSAIENWLKYTLPIIVLFLIILILIIYFIYKETKTKTAQKTFGVFIETKLKPFGVKERLHLRRLWYNLRNWWKSHQI